MNVAVDQLILIAIMGLIQEFTTFQYSNMYIQQVNTVLAPWNLFTLKYKEPWYSYI